MFYPPNHPICLMGFSIIFTIHFGVLYPYFWKHPFDLSCCGPFFETLQTSFVVISAPLGTTSHLVKRSMLRSGDFTGKQQDSTRLPLISRFFKPSGFLQIGEILLWWCQVPFEEHATDLETHVTFCIWIPYHVGRARNRRVIRDFQEFYEDKQFRVDVPKGGDGN